MPSKPTPTELTPFSTPQERFIANERLAKFHRDTVDKPEFLAVKEAALLTTLCEIAAKITDANSAMRAGFEASGAVQAMNRFVTLAEIEKEPPAEAMPGALVPTDSPRRP